MNDEDTLSNDVLFLIGLGRPSTGDLLIDDDDTKLEKASQERVIIKRSSSKTRTTTTMAAPMATGSSSCRRLSTGGTTTTKTATTSTRNMEGIDDDLIKIMARRSHSVPITDRDLVLTRRGGNVISASNLTSIDFSQHSSTYDQHQRRRVGEEEATTSGSTTMAAVGTTTNQNGDHTVKIGVGVILPDEATESERSSKDSGVQDENKKGDDKFPAAVSTGHETLPGAYHASGAPAGAAAYLQEEEDKKTPTKKEDEFPNTDAMMELDDSLPGAYAGAPGEAYGRVQQSPLPRHLLGDSSSRLGEETTGQATSTSEPSFIRRREEDKTEETDDDWNDSASMVPFEKDPGTTTPENGGYKRCCQHPRTLLLRIGYVLILVLTNLTTAILVGKGNKGECSLRQVQKEDNKLGPMEEEGGDGIVLVLPNLTSFTLEALKDPKSYQSLAYRWVENDPQLDMYEPWQLQQRFALACIYHAFQGQFWKDQTWPAFMDRRNWETEWLEYHIDECQWQAPKLSDSCHPGGEFKVLDLSGLYLSGYSQLKRFVPPEIALLPHLETINFSSTDIKESLENLLPLDFTGAMPALKTLNVSGCSLSGSIPSKLALLTSLTSLDLGKNDLTSTVPMELSQLSQLGSLVLSQNKLKSTIPSELGDLPSLSVFEINGNQDVVQPIPMSFCTKSPNEMETLWTDWCSSWSQCCSES